MSKSPSGQRSLIPENGTGSVSHRNRHGSQCARDGCTARIFGHVQRVDVRPTSSTSTATATAARSPSSAAGSHKCKGDKPERKQQQDTKPSPSQKPRAERQRKQACQGDDAPSRSTRWFGFKASRRTGGHRDGDGLRRTSRHLRRSWIEAAAQLRCSGAGQRNGIAEPG